MMETYDQEYHINNKNIYELCSCVNMTIQPT